MASPTLRDRLRYKADQFFQSGFTLQVTIAFSIVATLIVVFALIADVAGVQPGSDFDMPANGQDPFWPSVRFWWVLTHIFDTYWIEHRTFEQVFSTILTLLNYLVFAGVVGLVGSRIAARLEGIRRGTTRVVESGHIVLLGWSEKVYPIIRELAIGLEREKKVFVVLSLRHVDEAEADLRRVFGKSRDMRWVLRGGAPTDAEALSLLSLDTARAIVILHSEDCDGDADTQVIKSVITVAHALRSSGAAESPPVLIAELERPELQRIIRAAGTGVPVKVVQPSDYIARILLQTARERGMIDVYAELLGHVGQELHVRRFPELDGVPWRQAVFSFPRAIPVGVIDGRGVRLLPSAESGTDPIPADSRLVVLARDSHALETREASAYKAPPIPAIRGTQALESRRYLVLGHNRTLQRILSELEGYATRLGQATEVILISPHLSDPGTGITEEDAFTMVRVTVEQRDYLLPGVLESLHPNDFDAIIVLGEAGQGTGADEADTRVIMTLLLLQSIRDADGGKGPHIVAEIRNPSNRQLAEAAGCDRDIVITNELISRMIAQICREPSLDDVLRDLLNETGAEVYYKPLEHYIEEGTSVPFGVILAAALERGEIAIGIQDGPSAQLELNPPRDRIVHVLHGARVCVLSETEG